MSLAACAPGEVLEPIPAIEADFRCATDNGAALIGLENLTLCGNVVVGGSTAIDLFSNELIHLSGYADLAGDVIVPEGGIFERAGNAISMQGEMRHAGSAIVAEPDYEGAKTAAAADNAMRLGAAYTSSGLKLSGWSELSVPAGDYYFESGIKVSGRSTITLQGDVRFFVNGPVKFSGTTRTNGDGPYKFEIISVSSSDVRLSGVSEAQLHVSAPLAKVRMSGRATFAGTVLARRITISGTARITAVADASQYDRPCGDDGGDSTDGGGPDAGDDADDLPPAEGGPHQPDDSDAGPAEG